jgi:hypothetical protein
MFEVWCFFLLGMFWSYRFYFLRATCCHVAAEMVFPPELPEYMGAGFTTSFIMMGCRLLPQTWYWYQSAWQLYAYVVVIHIYILPYITFPWLHILSSVPFMMSADIAARCDRLFSLPSSTYKLNGGQKKRRLCRCRDHNIEASARSI